MSTHDLQELRKQIDAVDQQLISLLHQRMELVRKVGLFKKQNNIAPLDMNRWREVLASKMKLAEELDVDQSLVHDIYERIHQAALELEAKVV